MWIDSHCHIQDRYREEDLDATAAIQEARAAGVDGLICIGTDPESSRQAVELVSELRATSDGFGLWCTAGLHPHEASMGKGALAEIDAIISESQALQPGQPGLIVAVGECGLDYHYDHSPRHEQRSAFEAQVDMAKRHGLTLVVHTRNAWDDTLGILKSAGLPERTVIHCFTGGLPEAKRCLELGAYLSFSGIVTFKGAPEVREAAAACPADRLLVETDAPFLAPVPFRGKPNRPAWVPLVGESVAAARGESPRELAVSSSAATAAAFVLA